MTERADIREQLTSHNNELTRLHRERDELVIRGAEAGMQKTELASASGLSRQTVYDILQRHADEKASAEMSPISQVAAMWKLGQVVEDRWGLRWRADLVTGLPANDPDRAQRWCLRSVGLQKRRTHAQMVEREPLKLIRVDRVFAGPDALAERRAGEAEDAAVTVEPHEDPEP